MSDQITVTESLANGLKNRFFTEMVNGADLAVDADRKLITL